MSGIKPYVYTPLCYWTTETPKTWRKPARTEVCCNEAEFSIATIYDGSNQAYATSCAGHVAEQVAEMVSRDFTSAQYRPGITRWTVTPGSWVRNIDGTDVSVW